MGLLILVTGIFGGIAVAMATFYSLAQIVLTEGRPRLAHGAVVALTLAVMAALQFRAVTEARLLALPLLAAAFWAFTIERRWFRLFPLLQQLFAFILVAGWVAL